MSLQTLILEFGGMAGLILAVAVRGWLREQRVAAVERVRK